MKETKVDLLAKIPFFRVLRPDQLAIIFKFFKVTKVGKGKTLFQEGDKGDYICFIVDGRFDVFRKTKNNGKVILNTLSRGQSFGEMAIMEDLPRSATVKACTKATLITLTRRNFDMIMQNYPKIGLKILKGISVLLSRKLQTTSSRLAVYMSMSH